MIRVKEIKKPVLQIEIEKKELQEIIDNAESICSQAISYVGAANYAERERQALQNVRTAFSKLRKILLHGEMSIEEALSLGK